MTDIHPNTQGSISIHALHEESDLMRSSLARRFVPRFQSTLSMRRATRPHLCTVMHATFQSTLSMRRATRELNPARAFYKFQSTLSMRRATRAANVSTHVIDISIHALHEESDLTP